MFLPPPLPHPNLRLFDTFLILAQAEFRNLRADRDNNYVQLISHGNCLKKKNKKKNYRSWNTPLIKYYSVLE